MIPNIERLTVCGDSGAVTVQIFQKGTTPRSRGVRCKPTSEAVAKNNYRYFCQEFHDIFLSNFGMGDLYFGLNFPENYSDDQRIDEANKAIARIKDLFHKKEARFRYLFVFGSVDLNELNDTITEKIYQDGFAGDLHIHGVIRFDNNISYEDVLGALWGRGKKFKGSVFLVRIERQKYSTDKETLEKIANYFIKNIDEVERYKRIFKEATGVNFKRIGNRYFHSTTDFIYPEKVEKSDVDFEYPSIANEGGKSPSVKLKEIKTALENDLIEECLTKLYPDFRYQHKHENGRANLWIDDYGNLHFSVVLVRKNSPLDWVRQINKCNSLRAEYIPISREQVLVNAAEDFEEFPPLVQEKG